MNGEPRKSYAGNLLEEMVESHLYKRWKIAELSEHHTLLGPRPQAQTSCLFGEGSKLQFNSRRGELRKPAWRSFPSVMLGS